MRQTPTTGMLADKSHCANSGINVGMAGAFTLAVILLYNRTEMNATRGTP